MSLAIPLSRIKSDLGLLTASKQPIAAVSRMEANDIQALAQAGLLACPYREVQKIKCLFSNGVMLLRGQVSTFHMKQVAQTILMNIEGVKRIVNSIQVCPSKSTELSGPTPTAS
jgi:osmotically-inducible protein OsmY